MPGGKTWDEWISQYGRILHDWRFLFVGLRWWIAKMRGRA
jgi:hypothetical protein